MQKRSLENLGEVYKNITSDDLSFNQDTEIDLDYSKQKDKDLIKVFSLFGLPEIKKLKIDKIDSNDGNLKTFFKNSSPTSLKLLHLNLKCNYYELLNFKDYAKELEQWFKVTCDEIYVKNLEISSTNLSTIIKSSSHCKRLVIRGSKIDVSEELNFDIKSDYKIEELSFRNCGTDDKSNWKNNKSELLKILKAIKNCGLNKSLKKISLYNDTGFPTKLEDAKQIAREAELDENLIVDEAWEPTKG